MTEWQRIAREFCITNRLHRLWTMTNSEWDVLEVELARLLEGVIVPKVDLIGKLILREAPKRPGQGYRGGRGPKIDLSLVKLPSKTGATPPVRRRG